MKSELKRIVLIKGKTLHPEVQGEIPNRAMPRVRP